MVNSQQTHCVKCYCCLYQRDKWIYFVDRFLAQSLAQPIREENKSWDTVRVVCMRFIMLNNNCCLKFILLYHWCVILQNLNVVSGAYFQFLVERFFFFFTSMYANCQSLCANHYLYQLWVMRLFLFVQCSVKTDQSCISHQRHIFPLPDHL